MFSGIYTSAAGAMIQTQRHDVIAHNLANVETSGYRKAFTVFRHRDSEAAVDRRFRADANSLLERIGGGVFLDATPPSVHVGELQSTGNPYDLALVEDGWLTVSNNNGELFYTRSGAFTRSQAGEMVTLNGRYKLMNDTGQPVTSTQAPKIGAHGQLDNGQRLQIVRFDRPDQLKRLGANLFSAVPGAKSQPYPGEVLQGVIESSNVESVTEMVAMIEALRAYESNMEAIRTQNSLVEKVVSQLGRQPS